MTDNTRLFIPKRINVGYQNRDDTYNGKLAYVIYYDDKGVLRKEKSWQNWRSQKIKPTEFDNEPTEGFVLNKKVGGAKESYGWNIRNEYVRVYDPREFEFEISVPNLLFILKECDCSRGKGLEGKFVYAWSRDTLVLLPVVAREYKESREFTSHQAKKVSAKELVPGYTYTTKKQAQMVFLGKFNYYYEIDPGASKFDQKKHGKSCQKRFVFMQLPDSKPDRYGNVDTATYLVIKDSVSELAVLHSDVVPDNYSDMVAEYNNSIHGSQPVKLLLKKKRSPSETRHEGWWHEDSPGMFTFYQTNYKYRGWNDQSPPEITHISRGASTSIIDGVLTNITNAQAYAKPAGSAYHPSTNYHYSYRGGYEAQLITKIDWIEPTDKELYVELASGVTVPHSYKFRRDNG